MRKTLALLAAGTLALAACSGSSGGGRQTQALTGANTPGGRPAGEPSGPAPAGPRGIQDHPVGKPAGQPVRGTVPVNQTVLGMHFVQMRSTVGPVAASLRSEIASGGLTPPSPAVVQQIRSAIAQFDTAAVHTGAPSEMGSQIQALVSADAALISQLQSIGGGATVSPAASGALNSALAGWQSAVDQAGSALSA